MEAFLLGESYLVAFGVAIGLTAVFFIGFASDFWVVEVSVISCLAVPSLAVDPAAGFIDGLAVAAAKLDDAPATSVPATRSVTSTIFIDFLFGLNNWKVGWSDWYSPSFYSV